MKAMNKQDRVDDKNTINPWKPKDRSATVRNQETVEQFLMRGGSVNFFPSPKRDLISCYKKCHSGAFENIIK